MITQQILAKIEQYDTIIIHHHINPDPDTIGSQLGLKYLILESFPNKRVYAVGTHIERTRFLGPLDEITDEVYQNALVLIVDVGDKHRVDDQRFMLGKELIKIDHHPLSTQIADIEWVDTKYAACSEMIIDLYLNHKDKLKMNNEAARCLYSGLLTDTGRFYYNYVTERTLLNGAEVYKYDFDKQALYANIYHQSIKEMKFKGYIIDHFSHTEQGLAYLKIDNELLKQFNVSPDYVADMVNILSNIQEVILWIFFIEYQDLNNQIRVEFRSRGPIVNTLAKKYHGGGHMWASGALVEDWDTVEDIILDANTLCEQFNK